MGRVGGRRTSLPARASWLPPPVDFCFNSRSILFLSCPISWPDKFMGTFKTFGFFFRHDSSSFFATISWNRSPRTLFNFRAKLFFHCLILLNACCSISDAYLGMSVRGESEAIVALRSLCLVLHILTAAPTVVTSSFPLFDETLYKNNITENYLIIRLLLRCHFLGISFLLLICIFLYLPYFVYNSYLMCSAFKFLHVSLWLGYIRQPYFKLWH